MVGSILPMMFMKTHSLDSATRSGRSPLSSQQRRSLSGFTLVEVTLAIGIISFAFVAMFGMLPVGLNVSRQAMDTTIEAQIVQQMKTQALQTDYSLLEELAKPEAVLYFDDQGKLTEAQTASYKAGFSSVAKTTQLPSDQPSGVLTTKLATVTISVLNTFGNSQRAASDLSSAKDVKKFTILIPNNGL